ncbi:MAG: nucleotidyltransferase family protein [Candidatus Omnitrophica bacterium]|nr:nucleotidyltransferase family protein [Candidatus Omnitrophota bacterium]
MHNYRNAINSEASIDKLIIACLRNSADCQLALESVDLPHFNWQLFLKKIFSEGVAGLLFDNFSKWGLGKKLPDWVLAEIKQNYMRNLGRNLLIATYLESVLQTFEENQLEVLLLRGADFLSRLYPKLGSRTMSDVDLVIHKEDISKVKSCLEALGYRHPQGYQFLFDNNVLFIDLHIDYIGSYKLAQNSSSPTIKNQVIWMDAIPFKSNAVYVKTLSVYDAIVSCCAHLQEHSFSKLIWFYDIRNLIAESKDAFDWDNLILKARQFDLEKPVFYVLSYLNINRILSVPDKVMQELPLLKLNGLEKKSLKMLLSYRRSDISGELLYVFSKKGLISKFKCLWQSIFIDKENFHLSVEKITFWHYLKRFFSMSLYGIRKMFKLIVT